MELFERVRRISKECVGSETKLAAKLGLPQSTLNKYMNVKSQRNLWQYLPVILAAFPYVNRNWLYFDEGDMLDSSQAASPATQATPDEKDRLITELLLENRELRKRLEEKGL